MVNCTPHNFCGENLGWKGRYELDFVKTKEKLNAITAVIAYSFYFVVIKVRNHEEQ